MRELTVGAVDGRSKARAFALDPVRFVAGTPFGLARREQEQKRDVRKQTADDLEIEAQDSIDPEPARDALVGERRVEIPIGDDDRASVERGPDQLRHQLGARGGEQRSLGPAGHLRPVQEELSDPLAQIGATGLARRHNLPAVGGERLPQELRLRRLPGSVEPFERYEHGLRTIRRVRATVTGGAGFIGSNLVDVLLARGDEVTVVDNLSSGKRENVSPEARFVEADIRERLELDADVVFHLAAQADVSTSVAQPQYDVAVNVLGTVNVLEAARRSGAQVVFASTGGAMYGECGRPAREDDPREPLSPYGTAKLAGEEYLATWNRLYATSHVSLRFGNVYGPRQDSSLEGGVVAIFLERMLRGEPTTIFGDGLQERDFVYVEDVAAAVLAAVGHDGGVFNVGSGEPTSVERLHAHCREVSGDGRPPEYGSPRPGDLKRSVLDPSRAERQLGWRAQTSLEDGLRRTWDWLRSA